MRPMACQNPSCIVRERFVVRCMGIRWMGTEVYGGIRLEAPEFACSIALVRDRLVGVPQREIGPMIVSGI